MQSSSVDLEALRRRIQEHSSAAGPLTAEVLLEDLQTSYEELRVADEEVRTQQEHIEQLLESEQMQRWQHERMLALLPVPVLITDPHGVVRSANAPAAATFEMRVARMVGKPILSLVAPEDRGPLRTHLSRQANDGGTFQCRVRLTRRDELAAAVAATVSRSPVDGELMWMLLSSADAEASGHSVHRELPAALARLSRLQASVDTVPELLREAVAICQSALGDDVVVSLSEGPPLEPNAVAASDLLAQEMDGAQIRAGEGPCWSAFSESATVSSQELRTDPRWPSLGPRVPTPVRGAVAVPLEVGDRLVGALTAYRTAPGMTPWFVTAAELLGATVAAAIYELGVRGELSLLAEDMRRALTSRAVIDQAKGIVMARRSCDADEAFAHLVALSSAQERKLRDVARSIVEGVGT